jgi:hypothetical protein
VAADAVEAAYRGDAAEAEIDVAATSARGERSAHRARWLGALGALTAATGVILYRVGRSRLPAGDVAVSPTGGGAQVRVSWAF